MNKSVQKTSIVKTKSLSTLEITNFGGRLTRINNGGINSGLAKFTTSFGYDPFSKPNQLTWFETPVDITGNVVDLILAAKPRFEAGSVQYIYALGSTKKLYKITASTDTASVIATLANSSVNYGASMEFYGATEKIYVGMDDRVTSVNFDGSGEATVGTVGDYTANRYRPLVQFTGKLIFGNGTNVGAIDSTGTVISSVVSSHYEHLSPGFPPEVGVSDLDVSPDGNYLYITISGIANENLTTVASDRQAGSASNGAIYKWNGSDLGVTAMITIPSYAVVCLQTFLDKNIFFSNDAFGSAMANGSNKLLTVSNNKAPLPNATMVNGNFISWVTPEVSNTSMLGSMYYYGNLDDENKSGLWRVMRYVPTLSSGFVYQTPVNLMTNNNYSSVNNSVSSVVSVGLGKHYFSTFETNSASTNTYKLQKFLITPSGTGTPQLGVYETQNQLFSKKISISEIRVYCDTTVSGNGFQLDIIDSNGTIVQNGTFTYSFVSGTDPTLLQGGLQRINFNTNVKNLYSLALRITNTGTTNMVINKIEVDWSESGK